MDQHSQPEHSPENTLLTAQWQRISSLHLIAADAPGFAQVKQQVLEANTAAEPLIGGAPDTLAQQLRQSGTALRSLLEQEGSAPAPQDAKVYTQDEKRVIFLWATTYLLESLADELQNATLESDARAKIEQQLRGVLADTVRALNEEDGDDTGGDGDCGCAGNEDDECDNGLPPCTSCYPTYLACTLPPATCQANYTYCRNNCTK